MDTNLKGVFFLSREIARHMIQNGVHGNILNIASSSSIRPAISAYMLSKWGVRGLTEGLARLLVKHNIVVNAIAPGPTATPMIDVNSENIYRGESLIGRCVTPEEIAQMSVMLVSDSCRSIIGDIPSKSVCVISNVFISIPLI
jgi:NAD(P)-dependent dehydrogenase (short-subunit alcohol dehydrogenase family)